MIPRAYADIVLDHQTSQFSSIDQDDAFWTPRHIVPGGARETGSGDEHALGCTRSVDRPGEVAQGGITECGV